MIQLKETFFYEIRIDANDFVTRSISQRQKDG